MPKRLDEAEAISIMRSADFEPLEPYKLIKDPWKCKCLRCGNVTHPTLNNVKSGHGRGCKTCGRAESGRLTSIRKRTSDSDLDGFLRAKNLKILNTFVNSKSKNKFRCSICSHEFETKVAYLKTIKSEPCPNCRHEASMSREEASQKVKLRRTKASVPPKQVFTNVKNIAKLRGFKTEIEEARDNDVIALTCLICQENYRKKFFTVNSGSFSCRCSKPSLHSIKATEYLKQAQEYAKSRDGRILSGSIARKKDNVLWECKNGHQWHQPMGVVVGNRSWCKDCAGQTPRTLAELQDVAKARGGKVLSTTYLNVDATYDFECSIGHKFSNSFKHVVGRGQWCPTCNKGSKSEEICRTTFEQIFGFEFPKQRPKWLRNSRNRQMEIDGYCEELKIGFEYQGIQHFGKQFFGTSLDQRIKDDELKARLCKEHGINLFIIDYRMEYVDFPINILSQAKAFGMDTSLLDLTKPIDLDKAYIRDDRLPILKSLLKEKKITVLSTKWIGVKDKYDFRCDVCGHEWTATGSHFFNSRRVGGCQKCSIKLVAGANRLDIDEIQEFAKKHGGRCLSTDYGHIKQKYSFECSKGHVFEDIYNNMKSRNTFCRICEERSTKKYLSDEEAVAVLIKFNLQPLAPRPKLLSQGWPAKCLICGEEVGTSLQHLLDRGSPCKYCSGASISERKAREVFAKAKLEPIEPFKTGTSPWKSKCLICGSIVNGRYSNLTKGQSGCRTCYYRQKREQK